MHLIRLIPAALLLACQQGDSPADTGPDVDEPASWDDTVAAPVATEGYFAYIISRGFVPDGDGVAYLDPGAYAQASFPDAPVPLEAPNRFAAVEDSCWSSVEAEGWSTYADLGPTLTLDVGDEPVDVERWAEDEWIEYWWEELPVSPAFALEAGRALALEGVDLGVEIMPELVLEDFPSRWRSYRETGELHLTWEPSGRDDTRVVFSRTAEGRGEVCVLMDDGDERVVFPGPPPREVSGEFTRIVRGQYAVVEVEGRLVFAFSETDIHTSVDTGW